MGKSRGGFRAERPPVDESPFPDSPDPIPNKKKPFPLDKDKIVTKGMFERFDMFKCPYQGCFGQCRDEDRARDLDNLTVEEFTCKDNADHRWKFVRDVVDGVPQETGRIEALGWGEFPPPKEPEIESDKE